MHFNPHNKKLLGIDSPESLRVTSLGPPEITLYLGGCLQLNFQRFLFSKQQFPFPTDFR